MERPAHRLLSNTLYDPRFEHDGCGIGFVARISGEPSHEILTMALTAVGNLEHRGAVAADAKSGDGAGVLTQLPRKLLLRELAAAGVRANAADLALGVFFLPQHEELRKQCCALAEAALREHGLPLLLWRDVPTNDEALGQSALESKPFVRQAIMGRPEGASDDALERRLFLARKAIERAAREQELDLYVPSFSARSVVYKGLLTGSQVAVFYPDLRDPDYITALAVYHQRYATNTFPQWHLAQPFRMLSHNGEINTREGNKNWMRARESTLRLPGHEDVDLTPVIAPNGSDSSDLDNTLELLVQGGRDVRHALMMLAPEAWEKVRDLDPAVRAFYQYHACLIEPWDGPAALTFSDGRVVGTALDRNGLRPARYLVTDDGLVVSGSEVGAVPIDEARIVHKGKLGPGQIIAVDTAAGRLFTNDELKEWLAAQAPYGAWVKQHLKNLEVKIENAESSAASAASNERLGPPSQFSILNSQLAAQQQAFGYTSEELNVVLKPMLRDGQEPVGSMGDDTPMAVMSQWELGRPLFQFFKQRFAEVTNPPIDSLREELVMSHSIALGVRRNILEATPEHAHLIRLPSPILSDAQLAALRRFDDPLIRVAEVSSLVPIGDKETRRQGEGETRDARRETRDARRETRSSPPLVSPPLPFFLFLPQRFRRL